MTRFLRVSRVTSPSQVSSLYLCDFKCDSSPSLWLEFPSLVDKVLIVRDFNIHVDNPNDALGLAFTDLINSFGVEQNVTGPTHRYNHTLDLIISHGIDLTDIDIVPQSDDVTDHFLISCMLRITNINCRAPRYHPGRTIVPATKDRFTNNLPDLSQLNNSYANYVSLFLCSPGN